MPEHQEQEATITHFVPATLRRLDQSFDLTRGEVLAMAGVSLAPRQRSPFFHLFAPSCFVDSWAVRKDHCASSTLLSVPVQYVLS
jgi:hypothetical protein